MDNTGTPSSTDLIGAVHEQLFRFYKAYADTIWAVQQLTSADDDKIEELGNKLQKELEELSKRMLAIPDYAAEYSDDAKFRAKFDEVMQERAAVEEKLRQGVEIGEKRLANIDSILAAASKIVLDAHPWEGNATTTSSSTTTTTLSSETSTSTSSSSKGSIAVRTGGPIITGSHHSTQQQ